jgi:hypothetical protein
MAKACPPIHPTIIEERRLLRAYIDALKLDMDVARSAYFQALCANERICGGHPGDHAAAWEAERNAMRLSDEAWSLYRKEMQGRDYLYADPAAETARHARLGALLVDLIRDREVLRDALSEARAERRAIVDGTIPEDAGIAWANERIAEDAYRDAVERHEEAYEYRCYAEGLVVG